jgi:phytoene dehydrogenase-like protein
VAKVDFALSAPVPWINAEASRSPTVHLGGSRRDIAAAEKVVADGSISPEPYVLVSQPSTVDLSRAPNGKHVLWAYIHVPHGSSLDATRTITDAIEAVAPGFRDVIEASAAMSADELERYDPNFLGGDISSGALTLRQMLVRPVLSPKPWRTPLKGIYLSSSSTPPATGVHGMSGYYAARTALRDIFHTEVPDLSFRA